MICSLSCQDGDYWAPMLNAVQVAGAGLVPAWRI